MNCTRVSRRFNPFLCVIARSEWLRCTKEEARGGRRAAARSYRFQCCRNFCGCFNIRLDTRNHLPNCNHTILPYLERIVWISCTTLLKCVFIRVRCWPRSNDRRCYTLIDAASGTDLTGQPAFSRLNEVGVKAGCRDFGVHGL